jgi:hypothetical protein
MRRGSLSERTIRCGKAGCAYASNPKARHGPYHSLTQAVEGKTRSRFLTEEQAAVARQQIATGREFRGHVDTYWEACVSNGPIPNWSLAPTVPSGEAEKARPGIARLMAAITRFTSSSSTFWKSTLLSNCPVVDHLPVLSVEPTIGPQSVRPSIVVLTLTIVSPWVRQMRVRVRRFRGAPVLFDPDEDDAILPCRGSGFEAFDPPCDFHGLPSPRLAAGLRYLGSAFQIGDTHFDVFDLDGFGGVTEDAVGRPYAGGRR